MQTNRSPSVNHSRDPVAQLVEEELGKLARNWEVEAALESPETGRVELRFDGVVVTAETRDIALVRLGCALLDKERYREVLVNNLGPRLNAHL
jgi:hypothetical protein